ncbi:MAG: tRNA pseudouridine(38-40) synthase TruA [Pirellula sp.]|jgi:tRNA pseudouridine38-40 synthase
MASAFALTVAYDGTRYAGWQIQPNGLAVQQVLSDAVSEVIGHSVQVQGSGRTDSGVHATGQVCSFATDVWSHPADRLVQAINQHLPRDIVVLESRGVVAGFDPIRNAIGKRYRYTIRMSRVPDPIHHPYHWWIPRQLDIGAMRDGAARLIGTHDFKAFEAQGSTRKTSVRTVRALEIAEREHLRGRELTLEIEANGFLYNMVRNITGALVAIGSGRVSARWLEGLLESKARDPESKTAPARGLCLIRVDYPPHLFLPSEGAG